MKKYLSELGVFCDIPEFIEKELIQNQEISINKNFFDPKKFKYNFGVNALNKFSDEDNFTIAEAFFILKNINFKAFDNSHVFVVNFQKEKHFLLFYEIQNKKYKMSLYNKKEHFTFDKSDFVYIKNFQAE